MFHPKGETAGVPGGALFKMASTEPDRSGVELGLLLSLDLTTQPALTVPALPEGPHRAQAGCPRQRDRQCHPEADADSMFWAIQSLPYCLGPQEGQLSLAFPSSSYQCQVKQSQKLRDRRFWKQSEASHCKTELHASVEAMF